MKYLFFFILLNGLASCNFNPETNEVGPELLKVPYDHNPETPSQLVLDSLAVLPMDSLVKKDVEITQDRKQVFYTLNDRAYTGWATENLLSSHNRIRYYQIDSGFVNWQIGYFDNGQLDCDFHALDGFNHGSQRMWSRDGTPYVNLNSIMDKKHGLQQRWHPNGQLDWQAEYVNDSLLYEVKYTPEGKIKSFDGSFTLPIPDDKVYEEIKQLLPEWNSSLGAYLSYYYEVSGDKNQLRTRGTRICHYTIEFAKKITYEANTCRASSNVMKLSMPKTSNAFIKKLLYSVVRPWDDNDPFKWSSDTLFFTENGIPNTAGCNIEIEHTDSLSIVKMYCTD